MSRKDEKKVILSGSEEALRPIITQILAINQLLEDKDIGSFYGMPTLALQAERKFHPQIKLHFKQPKAQVDKEYGAITGEIGFRIMNATPENLTLARVTELANKIKTKFGKPPFLWAKGKEMISYSDWQKGYQLQLLCKDVTEGRRVVEQILDVQGHSPDWDKANLNKNQAEGEKYPEKPAGNKTILEKPYKEIWKRPIANVEFSYAELHVHGMGKPMILVDLVGKTATPLIEAN